MPSANDRLRDAVPGGRGMAEDGSIGVEADFGLIPRFITATGCYRSLSAAAASVPSVSIDFQALNVFLRTGLFLNGATPLREVRRAWPPPVIAGPDAFTRQAFVNGYITLFTEAVRRRIDDEAILALSGGEDSRHILLELRAQGRQPRCAVTVNVDSSDDAEVASRLARRVGIEHVVVAPGSGVAAEIYKNPATDFLSLQHAWLVPVARARDARAWWDGIGGDVLSAGLFLEPWNLGLFESGRLDELADRLVARGDVPLFEDQDLFPREAAVAELRAELELHREAANPIGSFYFWNRTRGDIASSAFRLLRPSEQRILAPYLDRDVWQLLSSIPARMLLDHRFHREVIAQAYPELADIPYAKKRSPPAWVYRRMSFDFVRYLVPRLITSAGLDHLSTLARTLLCIVDVRRRQDIEWILRTSVYCHSILEMVGAGRPHGARAPQRPASR